MFIQKKFFLIFSVILFASAGYGEDANQIMLKNYNLDQGKDFKIEMKMDIINKSNKKKERKIIYWKIERGDEDKSLIYFVEPESVKGTSFLSWEHKNKDDDQWLYLPALKNIRRIAAAEKDKSFMGTDFSYNDLTQPHPSEFVNKLIGEEIIDNNKCYKIESIHKSHTDDPAYKKVEKYQYAKTISWISISNYVTIKAQMFDNNGELLKEFYAKNIKEQDSIWTVFVSEMVDVKEQHKTVLTITNVKYNIGLNDNFFSERELTKQR